MGNTKKPPLKGKSRATEEALIEFCKNFIVGDVLLQLAQWNYCAVCFLKWAVQLEVCKDPRKGFFVPGTCTVRIRLVSNFYSNITEKI